MSVIQSCHDTNDILEFFKPQGLYLKPIARLNVSVQLPQLKKSGAKISNWEVMERVKEMAKPFTFPVFKVAKSSLEFIRFEAEIENYGSMEQVLAKLDMKTIKLSGFQELLKVRAAESKPQFPTRYDWDTFFMNNKDMNEMKPGERPDTIHVQNLPTKWFFDPHDKSGFARDKPSEYVLKKVFATFGDIRAVDIPLLDPYRDKMKSTISGIQTFTFGQDLVFEAYIQFMEYIGFVKAMNSLKGMKLLYKDRYEEKAWAANIKVDFDRTKHLAESTIKQRSAEREKIIKQERDREEAERKKRELEELKKFDEKRRLEAEAKRNEAEIRAEKDEKIRRRMEREERRRLKRLGLTMSPGKTQDEEFVNKKIILEERKLLVAQRKLESIRLIDELLDRVKIFRSRTSDPLAYRSSQKFSKKVMTYKDQDEKLIHEKLVSKLKEKEKLKVEQIGEKLRCVKESNRFSAMESLDEISDVENSGDDLRLTSTDEDDNLVNNAKSRSRSRDVDLRKVDKKKKKRKKEKKQRSLSDPDDEAPRTKKKMRKELLNQISIAKKISARENEPKSPPAHRRKSHYDKRRMICRDTVEDRKERGLPVSSDGFPSYIDTVMQERELRRQEARLRARLQKKLAEQQSEELYDRMIHPHLYGDTRHSKHSKPKRGEHYEETQKAMLAELKAKKEYDRRRAIRSAFAGKNGAASGYDRRRQDRNFGNRSREFRYDDYEREPWNETRSFQREFRKYR